VDKDIDTKYAMKMYHQYTELAT